MGYRFRGFFSDGDAKAMEAAVELWPFCTARPITDPFHGFGLRAPDPDSEAASDEEYGRLLELPYAVMDGLVDFSLLFLPAAFVFVDADCFAGTCMYTGFAVRAGVVVVREDTPKTGTESLGLLLAPMGIPYPCGHFAPFVRGFLG